MIYYDGVPIGTGYHDDKFYTLPEYLTAFLVTYGMCVRTGITIVDPKSMFFSANTYEWSALCSVGLMKYDKARGTHCLTEKALKLIKENQDV